MTDPHIERIRQLDAAFEADEIDRATYDVHRQRALRDSAQADADAAAAEEKRANDVAAGRNFLLSLKITGALAGLIAVFIAFPFIYRALVPPAPEPTRPASALEMMEVAFKGNPSQRDIQELLDPAMRAAGLPISDANYQRAGSVLVALGQKNNISEMTILRCIPQRTEDRRIAVHDFESVAAVCAVDIIQGLYQE